MKSSSSFKRNLTFAWAGIVLCVVGGLAWANRTLARQYKSSFDWVTHTELVLQSIEETVSLVKDVETGMRGFAVTGETEYLQPYHAALPSIEPALRRLRELTADNPSQLSRLARLEPLISDRIIHTEETVEARETRGFQAALEVIHTGKGRVAMESIRSVANEMKEAEQRLLTARQLEAARSLNMQHSFGVFLLVILVGASGAVFWMRSRLNRMQEIVRICAWTQKIQHEEEWLTAEEYLQRRFGLTPSHGMSDGIASEMQEELADLAA